MFHPSSLIRLAVIGSVVLLVRAIVREASQAHAEAALLPPPGRIGQGKAARPRRLGVRRGKAASR